jgi:putative FmdB family regulatory protein
MPTYDYRCQACGHALEVFQSISEAPKKKCPKCGKARLERLIGSGAGILFKGGGFYQTDYRSESYKKAESADKSGSTSSDTSASKSPEAAPKPAEKSGEASSANRGEKKKPRE